MAQLDLGALSMTIEVDGRAAIFEMDRVREAAEDSATDSAQAYQKASRTAQQAFEGVGDAAERAGESGSESAEKVGSAAKQAGQQVEGAAQKSTESLKTMLDTSEKVGTTLTTAVTAPLTALYTAMVKGASDLTETIGKTDVVFGEFTDSVMDWSEGAIESMGLAQGTALDTAATYGDMATGMGIARAEAAEMGMTLTQLSADMASFKNISQERVAQALTAVYTGETEALKSLGIVMTQTNLEAYALSQGITKQIADMTQAEQVQLRYSYVLAQTANAQGDFARTGGNLANQSRALIQTLKETGTGFGEILTPMVTKAVSGLREAALYVAQLDDNAKTMLLSIGAAAAAFGPLTLGVTKAVKAFTALKAAMAVSTFNPVMLAVTALTAAVGVGLYGALKKSNEEMDTTSSEYQHLKSLMGQGGTATITVGADTQDALDTVQDLIDDLQSDKYKGTMTIDGNPQKAEEALAALEAAVQAMTSGTGSVAQLQAAIAACEELTITPGMDEATRLEVQGKLDALNAQLEKLKNPTVTWSVSQAPDSDEEAWDAFHEKIVSLGWEKKTFSATGKFEVDPATTEQIEAYALALANAATATEDYDAAVESLNALLDEQLQAQMAQINQQVDEQTRNLVARYNEGYLSDSELEAGLRTIMEQALESKKAIQEVTEAKKEQNEILADGILENDFQVFKDQMLETYAGETLDETDLQGAIRTLEEARAAGEDMTQYADDAMVVNGELAQQAISNYEAMIAAQQEYEQAIASANEKETEAIEANQEVAENAALMQAALEEYSVGLELYNGDAESGISYAADALAENAQEYEAIKEQLTQLLTNPETGELMTADYGSVYDSELTKQQEAQMNMEQAMADAETTRANAAESFTTTLEGLTADLTSAETQMLLELTASTGTAISESDAALVAGTTSLMEQLSETMRNGGGNVAGEISGMITAVGNETSNASSEGADVGAAITSGITSGLETGTGTLYATVRRIVNKAIAAAKTTAEIASPSKRAKREIGAPIIQGITGGVEEETPNAIRAIQESTRHIISGAASVVDNGTYTIPTVQAIGGMSIDYDQMGEALGEAVSRQSISIKLGEEQVGRAMRTENARQAALRQHEINIGKGRIRA